jgi:catechol 2,3-dioxygenase-like lactoylglutathione lyase family enzyme
VAVCVHDLAAGQAFYEALGFAPGPVYTSAGRRVAALMESEATSFSGVFLRLGEVLIELLAYDPPIAPPRSPRAADQVGYAHVSLVVDDLAAATAEVQAHGGARRTTFEHAFADGVTAIAFVTDPSGNRVELIEHSTPAEREAHGAYLGLDALGWPAEVRPARR